MKINQRPIFMESVLPRILVAYHEALATFRKLFDQQGIQLKVIFCFLSIILFTDFSLTQYLSAKQTCNS